MLDGWLKGAAELQENSEHRGEKLAESSEKYRKIWKTEAVRCQPEGIEQARLGNFERFGWKQEQNL